MVNFKFFSGVKVQYIPIITRDSLMTHHIPIDMYGHILELAVDLHRENMALFNPVEYRIQNEIGVGVTYYYQIDNVVPYYDDPNRISIEYSIKFPDTEYYSDFITSERLSLYV